MVGDACQGVFYAVGMAIDNENAAVIHLQPDVLPLVNGHAVNAVVHALDAAGVSGPVVVEIIAIESRHTIPCRYPDVSVVVMGDVRYHVTG